MNLTRSALSQIAQERVNQDAKWGPRQHHELLEWWSILTEEYVEAAQAMNSVHFGQHDISRWTEELVQVAAVVCAILEDLMDQGIIAYE